MGTTLTIIALDKVLYHGAFASVTIPGSEGEMTILPHHMSLVTALSKGKLTVRNDEEKETIFEIEGGTAEIGTDGVTILVDPIRS